MNYAIGVIAFVVGLLVSVMLHETGHFATAKAFGMKASRFFVGFGPTLWSFRRGETEYGVKAIPAGGFVKIEGMTQLEELDPADTDRAFWRQSAPKRTVVLAAGSVVHFILAILIVFGYLAISHEDPIREVQTAKVGDVVPCLSATGSCKGGALAAPAAGKLRGGDTITAVDGRPVSSGKQLVSDIQGRAGQLVTLTVDRGKQSIQVPLRPVGVRENGRTVGKIGVDLGFAQVHVPLGHAPARTFTFLGDYLRDAGQAIGGLPHEVATIFQGKPRGVNSPESIIGAARLSGQAATISGLTSGQRIGGILLLIAELNLFVGIFNLLPLLPLDGGHIAILLFESIRSRVYRLFGRRDPGRVNILKVLPVTYAVVVLFIGLSLILIYADLFNPVQIG